MSRVNLKTNKKKKKSSQKKNMKEIHDLDKSIQPLKTHLRNQTKVLHRFEKCEFVD